MAGHDDRDGIAPARHADRPWSGAQRHRHAAIGRSLAVGDLAHHLPHALLEIGAACSEWQLKAFELAGEVAFELVHGLFKYGIHALVPRPLAVTRPAQAGQGIVIGLDRQPADRARDVTN